MVRKRHAINIRRVHMHLHNRSFNIAFLKRNTQNVHFRCNQRYCPSNTIVPQLPHISFCLLARNFDKGTTAFYKSRKKGPKNLLWFLLYFSGLFVGGAGGTVGTNYFISVWMGRPKKTEEGCFLSKAAATLAIVPVKVSPVVAVVNVGLLDLKAKKAPTRLRLRTMSLLRKMGRHPPYYCSRT